MDVGQRNWVNLKSQLTEDNYFSCKLTVHSKYEKVSELISQCLTDVELKFYVERTQFGNLVKYAGNYNLSSQIIWFMLIRQVYLTSDDEIWFVVNDRPIRFSRMEYALLTGLDCSDNFSESVLDVSDFCVKHFEGRSKITVKEVELKLNDLRSGDDLFSMDRVKMACVYFVSGVLLPAAPIKNPQVDKEIFSLIDDFEVFNKYPWGTKAFKGALCDLKCDLKCKKALLTEKIEHGKCARFGTHDMFGFINPLQVLAYECVVGIGERFAVKMNVDGTPLPRMCRWVSNHWLKKASPRYVDIVDASNCGEKMVRGLLVAGEEERSAPYVLNILSKVFTTDSHLAYINSLLVEGKTVFCTRPSGVFESEEDVQSREEVPETSVRFKKHGKRSRKSVKSNKDSPKKAAEVERDDVSVEGNVAEQLKLFQERVDSRFSKLENMICKLDSKVDDLMKVLNVSTSSKRPLNEPTSVSPPSKRKARHECVSETAFSTENNYVGTKLFAEPFTSRLSYLASFVTGDFSARVSPQAEVVFEDDNEVRGVDSSCPANEPLWAETEACGKEIVVYTPLTDKRNDMCDSPKDVPGVVGHGTAISLQITPSPPVRKYARRSTKSQFFRSPYVQLPDTPALTALGYTGPYDGSFEPLQCVSVHKVFATVRKEIGQLSEGLKDGVYGSYRKSWFRDLLGPRHWLDQSHIQESIHGLSLLQKNYPLLVKQDVAIMDPYFSQDVFFAYQNARDDFQNSKWKSLFRYADGYCRRWSSVPWAKASSILIPLNLPMHWVAVLVNVADGIITIYDCNHACFTDAEVDGYIQPLENVVQHLLHYCKVKIPDLWSIFRPKEFPQNSSSSDCGAWLIKTFEVELSLQSPFSLTDKIVNSYRKYLAMSVWYGEWIL